jgi:hypothetical protein
MTADDMARVLAVFRVALDRLGVASGAPVPDDPVAVYDIMRDAATDLGSLYAGRVGVGGLDDPAVAALRALDAEVMAVAPDDLAAQKAMTVELRRRYAALAAEGGEVEP